MSWISFPPSRFQRVLNDDDKPEPRRRDEDGSDWLARLWDWMLDRREARIGRELAAALRRKARRKRDDEHQDEEVTP